MIINVTVKVVEKLRSLPLGQKEVFAASFTELTAKLGVRVDYLLLSRETLLVELLDPLL